MSQRRALLAKAQVVVLQSCFSVTSVFSPVRGRSLFQSHGHLHCALVSPSPERHRSQLLSPSESLTLQEPSHIHSSYVHARGHLKSDLAVYGSSHSSPYSYLDMFVVLLTFLGIAYPIPQTNQVHVPLACVLVARVVCPFPPNDHLKLAHMVRVACLFPLDEWAPLVFQVTICVSLH